MKKAINFYNVFMILSFFFLFCTSDDDKGNDSGRTDTTQGIQWTASETVNIGPDNLTIEKNGISIEFQSSQITNSYDIQIYKGQGSSSYYQDAETEILGLEFQTKPSENIQIQVSIETANPNENTIFFGIRDKSKSDGVISQIVIPTDAAISGENLTAEITLPLGDIQSIESSLSLKRKTDDGYIFGLFGGKKPVKDSTEHFILEKPAANRSNLTTYLGYLEEAYSKLNALGFPMDSISAAAKGKIQCYIGNTGKNNQNESNLEMYYMISNHVYITDDETALGTANSGDVKATYD